MPLGTRHDEVGRLNERAGRWSLRLDGGGEWRLELSLRAWWRARGLVGRRVRISGVRDGFDLLHVTSVVAAVV